MPDFLNSEYYVTMLGSMCERFGQRPSEILGITDNFVKIDFDMAIHYKYGQITKKYVDKDTDNGKGKSKEINENETKEEFEQRKAEIGTQFKVVNMIKGM